MFGKKIPMQLLCVTEIMVILLAGLWTAEQVPASEQTVADMRECRAAPSKEEEDSWLDPLEGTAALRMDFPVETEFYAAGIAESTLKEMGIDGSDVPPGKLADAADRLSRSMTERQKELIRSDGMMIRGLAFGKMYLITGRAVRTEEGLVTPLPFLIRPAKEQKLITVEAKYTIEKTPPSESEPADSDGKTGGTDSGAQPRTGGGQKKSAVSVTLKKKNGSVSLEPVQTGDIDLREIAVTVLSAFILGLAVIIRKRIK